MPLILMCGIPGSGKTKRAFQIANYLRQKHNQQVVVINEQGLQMDKNLYYKQAKDEKIIRGRIKFETEKNLLANVVVIVDSLNYIKGFRYQMYCVAREQKSTYCVVYCNTSRQKAKEFNELNKEKGFNNQLFEDVANRMEAPCLKSRWDIPLFERRQDQETPLQQIANVLLFEAKKSKDPVSTKQEQKLSEDYLYQVDQIQQNICESVLMGKLGGLKNNWSAIELKKVKKDFMNVIKEQPMPLTKIKDSFNHYLIQSDKRK